MHSTTTKHNGGSQTCDLLRLFFQVTQTIKDLYSKFLWIFVIYSKTAEEITNNVFSVFAEWGYPQILHTDNGGEFTVLIETKRLKEHGIDIRHGVARPGQWLLRSKRG